MKKIYLIDQRDILPENDNGSMIIEAYSPKDAAFNRAKELSKQERGIWYFLVQELIVDATEAKAVQILYPDDPKE